MLARTFLSVILAKGHPVVAYAWRGTSGTYAGGGVKKVKAEEHVEDLKGLFGLLPSIHSSFRKKKPIVVCHSFGGILFMKYLESLHVLEEPISDHFSGIIMLNSSQWTQ